MEVGPDVREGECSSGHSILERKMKKAYGEDRQLCCQRCVRRALGRCSQPLARSVNGVDSFGIWLLPTMFAWHPCNWSFQSKISVQPTSGRAGGLPMWGPNSKSSSAWPAAGTGQFWPANPPMTVIGVRNCIALKLWAVPQTSDFRACL
jgi:hypothetical protein